jgi:hypothetical protein
MPQTALTPETRFITGETWPVDSKVATDTALKIGDLVGIDAASGEVVPVSNFATEAEAAAVFAGISGQAKAAGVEQIRGNSRKNRVRIDTDGIWEIPCAVAVNTGQLLGFKLVDGKVATQEVVIAADATTAVGYCVLEKPATETHVRIRLVSQNLGLLSAK